MAQDGGGAVPDELPRADAGSRDLNLNAVLAHGLLGTAAAIKGAVDTIRSADNLDRDEIDALLEIASRRLDFLIEQIRDLVLGFPEEVILFLDTLRNETATEPAPSEET